MKRNHLNLKYFADLLQPDFMFISETNTFSHDIHSLMKYFSAKYCFFLNSEDNYDPELPLARNMTYGGTMVIWKLEHDAHITVFPVSTTSFLPIIYSSPGAPVSEHIALYFPTSGQESEFTEQIILLRTTILDLKEKYPDCLIYLRGDCNVNPNNRNRFNIFSNFLSTFDLTTIPLNHKTYHHFLGEGQYDSNIDIIAVPKSAESTEKLIDIVCSKDEPGVDSHHDIIVSSLSIPVVPTTNDDLLVTAPRVPNHRHKTIWSDKSIAEYRQIVSPPLQRIRTAWATQNSTTSVSILLRLTNEILIHSAASTNKSIPMNAQKSPRSASFPLHVRKAHLNLKKAHCEYKIDKKAYGNVLKAKREYRIAVRKQRHVDDLNRDEQLYNICAGNPGTLYRKIRASKSSSACSVPFLKVRDKMYPGEKVADGFFDSIQSLKTQNKSSLHATPNYSSWSEDYKYILELCKHKKDLPIIDIKQSSEILSKMKSSVADYWSITPLHFINAGTEGLYHFNFLMNQIILNVNASSSRELNTVYALLLHKGHGKSKTSDRSYRTISTCPVLAKGLDMYIHDLFIDQWNAVQADTQYQGKRSNHELASLLITESIQESLYHHHSPLFILFLDARSAFDTVVISFLVRNLYFSGMVGNSLSYVNNRLSNRLTFCDWNKEILGPVQDQQGLEQGGCISSDEYKIYNNDLLKTVQKSCQGVDLGKGLVISGIGQADDVALVSNSVHNLGNILNLALSYCTKYHIGLSSEKTKLLVVSKNGDQFVPYNPIRIAGENIGLSDEAEHVGILRCSSGGNIPHILNRFTAHRKSLAANLFAGSARSHRGNLVACLKLEKTYSLPVLLSGLGSLLLSKAEVRMIDQHYSNVLKNLLKTHPGTPKAFVLFLAGSLPGTALVHLRHLSLFSMITRLPNDPLHKRAVYALTSAPPSWRSWFSNIRDICLQYRLPHPLTLLRNPVTKDQLKKLCKTQVIDYWQRVLRHEVAQLSSLKYFKAQFHSLATPHPIIWTPGANPYEVTKAVIQLKMLSGRYRTALLTKHWGPNRSGCCPAPGCTDLESLEHLLVVCPYYDQYRAKLKRLWLGSINPCLKALVSKALLSSTNELVQFILDASVLPQVISNVQTHGKELLHLVFHLTRTWCFTIHRERVKLLKLLK